MMVIHFFIFNKLNLVCIFCYLIEKTLFKDNDVSITTSLSINGRLFLAPNDHLDALTPLPEQEGPSKGNWQILEMFGSKEIAYTITLYE
jgi:Rap guanine nucleotide exchange factor 4